MGCLLQIYGLFLIMSNCGCTTGSEIFLTILGFVLVFNPPTIEKKIEE